MGNIQNSKNIESIAFNRKEIELIRNHWQKLLRIGLSELGLGLMTRILIEHKDLKCMWRKKILKDDDDYINIHNTNYKECMELKNPNYLIKSHGEKVFNTIKIAINSIDDLTSLAHQLNEMGYEHYKYGTRNEHFYVMGEALISTLSDALKDDWNEYSKKTWIKFFRIIEFQMKIGMHRAASE